MRLLQINTAAGRGAAGGIPETLGAMAAGRGMRSVIAAGRPCADGSASELMRVGGRIDFAVHALATRLADRHGLHSRAATLRFIAEAERLDPHIVHLHNIHGYYLHLPTLADWLRGAGRPVVWTLHDCWALTGHCAFFNACDCTRWQTQCHHCPMRRSYPASWLLDRSAANHRLKKRLFATLPGLTIVCVSRWLDSVVAQSYLRDIPRRVIPNGIDTSVFHPCAPKAPADAPLLLGVASHWDERKGLADFVRLRTDLPAHWRIRLIGLTQAQIRSLPQGIEGMGRIASAGHLAAHYSEATVFANATKAESSCMTKMEALACGTPVVTYAAGGGAEGVPPEVGAAVAPGDYGALKRAVKDSPSRYNPDACRAAALRNFDMQRNLYAYFDLYETLASKNPNPKISL